MVSAAPPANLHVSRHPLLRHKLALLRSADTPPPQFRALVRELTHLLLYEALADVALAPLRVQTPLAACEGEQMAERIGLLPILRAGLGMAEAVLDLVPSAVVWHLGLYRDHRTLQPITYYNKMPPDLRLDLSLVVDPMLATGGSAVEAINLLKQGGSAGRIKYLGLIAAAKGVDALTRAHPDVPIHLAAVDGLLDEHSYIVPGLGDAGDRQFGTH
jgi:uracil phosphoribosyltransferase